MAAGMEASGDGFMIADYQQYLAQTKLRFDTTFGKVKIEQVKFSNYTLLQVIGTGGFGVVFLARDRTKNKYQAIKALKKSHLVAKKQVAATLTERDLLHFFRFNFLMYLTGWCMDNSHVYLIMPFIEGGELFDLIQSLGKYPENHAKFYASQVVLALEYMHNLKVVYRDLKPENLIMDRYGYIKVTDFGFSKVVTGRTYTLCGTPEYLAPEIIFSKGYGITIDWWCMGVLIYELCAGFPPFNDSNHMRLYEKIVQCNYRFPRHFSPALRDLLKNMIQSDVSRRYGNLRGGISDIKGHVWFQEVDWMSILNRKVHPPYIPKIRGRGDVQAFDSKLEEVMKIDPKDKFAKNFANF